MDVASLIAPRVVSGTQVGLVDLGIIQQRVTGIGKAMYWLTISQIHTVELHSLGLPSTPAALAKSDLVPSIQL